MEPLTVYKELLERYGHQHWWPVHRGKKRPGFDPVFEMCIGGILTQNTSWSNVEKAIEALHKEHILDAKSMTLVRLEKLRRLIKPAGYFNQKARKLRIFARAVMNEAKGSTARFMREVSRDDLLALWGIGPETADSMLLYGGKRTEFVIDAYTKRLCATYGIEFDSYNGYKEFFTTRVPPDVGLYNELHALIVRWGQEKKISNNMQAVKLPAVK